MMDLHRDFTHFQEGARRYQAAMAGVPDRVPVFAQMHEFVMRRKGLNARDFFTGPILSYPPLLKSKMNLELTSPMFVMTSTTLKPKLWVKKLFSVMTTCPTYTEALHLSKIRRT